jgi:hypothetical protein
VVVVVFISISSIDGIGGITLSSAFALLTILHAMIKIKIQTLDFIKVCIFIQASLNFNPFYGKSIKNIY